MRHARQVLTLSLLCILPAVTLAACSGSLNPFKKAEQRLPGERISIAKAPDEVQVDAAVAKTPVVLPAPKQVADWTQPGGIPSNAPGHLQVNGALALAWRADAGNGSSKNGRLTASPVIYQNKIFTLDTKGIVSAFSTGGSRVWRVDLTPEHEKGKEGFGGGLAADDGRLYVTTGYGTVVALNPANGQVIWTRKIGVPVRSSPTAAAGKVFLVTTESRVHSLSGADGNDLWTHRGIPETATLLSNVSPAVTGDRVVVPFPSGDVIAFDIASGKPTWVESLARKRGGSPLATLSDPARPVIDRGIVFAVGHAGRMVATSLANGERLWTKGIRGIQAPWVAGEYVFVVDVEGKLLALTRRGGQVRWATDLPHKGRWNGPVLASGRLWLVSSNGLLVGVDATTGQIAAQRQLGEEFFIPPIVASGRMYILSDKARLFALN